jgi:hypothetical protein
LGNDELQSRPPREFQVYVIIPMSAYFSCHRVFAHVPLLLSRPGPPGTGLRRPRIVGLLAYSQPLAQVPPSPELARWRPRRQPQCVPLDCSQAAFLPAGPPAPRPDARSNAAAAHRRSRGIYRVTPWQQRRASCTWSSAPSALVLCACSRPFAPVARL